MSLEASKTNKQEIGKTMKDLAKMQSGFGSKETIKQLIALEERLRENPNDTDALLKKGILYYEPFL